MPSLLLALAPALKGALSEALPAALPSALEHYGVARKEEVRQMKAEAARLLALQKANSTPSAATFTPPECYVATVSSEIRNVNASMPMISCPTVCIVKGACQCGSGSTG